MTLSKRPLISLALLLVATLSISSHYTAAFAHSGESHEDNNATPVVLAPGYEKLNFPPPDPGSYSLPVLGPAGDGKLLASSGESVTLHEVLNDKISVLSFIYQACNDVNGCPLATYVMHQLRQSLEKDETLHDRVQLLSLSFDPVNDTPESMQAYRDSFGQSTIDWQFLTTRSVDELTPLLAAYDQSLSRQPSDATQINHVLRVYLIDESRQIRNIFSSSLLHADTLISDIRTLALESSQTASASDKRNAATDSTSVVMAAASPEREESVHRANDDRAGYAQGTYVSNTRALSKQGETADLLTHALRTPLGLPALPGRESLTAETIALGRQLFFDRRLSINNTVSCAMCHVPQQGFTVNEMSTAVGVEGRTVKRNAPTLLNVGFLSRLFHDGRETRLEQQVWSPLLAHNEMANPSVGYVLDKIAGIPEYSEAFETAFGYSQPTMESLGKALSDYQRTLVAANSPFDQWRYGGDETTLSAQAKAGYQLFTGEANCSRCHLIGADNAPLTDGKAHNTGIGYARSMQQRDQPHPVTLAPGMVVMVDPAVYADAAETPPNDLGLYEVTQKPADRWKFQTPSLRNIALTAPYMHDGSMANLEEVIDFYSSGGLDNPLLSPLIEPLHLSEEQRGQLLAFLMALSSPDVDMLISDGIAAPVGDWNGRTLQ